MDLHPTPIAHFHVQSTRPLKGRVWNEPVVMRTECDCASAGAVDHQRNDLSPATLFLISHVAQNEIGQLRHKRPQPGILFQQ